MIVPGGLLLIIPTYAMCSPHFSFMGGVAKKKKKKKTKLGCEKY
jgi:hypothetical protein